MEQKGIVRRLDDLGRIVIPKEYRRMFKIEIGDPLEIYANDNGDIVLRRFGLDAMVLSEGRLAAEALAHELDKAVAVADREKFIDGVNLYKNDVIGLALGAGAMRALDGKAFSTSTTNDAMEIDYHSTGYDYVAMAAINNNGKRYGALALFDTQPISAEDVRLLSVTAQLVSINLQRY